MTTLEEQRREAWRRMREWLQNQTVHEVWDFGHEHYSGKTIDGTCREIPDPVALTGPVTGNSDTK